MPQLIGDASFNTQISMWWGWHKLVNPLLTHVVREVMLWYNLTDELNKLLFSPKTVYSYNERFSTLGEVGDLQEIPESGIAPDLHISKWKDKWYKFITWGWKLSFTRLVTEWINATHNLTGISASDVTGREALQQIKNAWIYLADAATRKLLEEWAKIYTKWFQATQINGPAGTWEDGEPLFSIHHPYRDGTEEYANCWMEVWGQIIHPALSEAALINAIQMLKWVKVSANLQGPVKQNGMKIPNIDWVYDLIIPTELEVTAGKILNVDARWIPTMYNWKSADANGNSMQTNVFSWNGYKIRLIPMTIFGWTNDNGETIWNGTCWFLRNNSIIRQTRSLQMANLNGNGFGMKTWIDPNTDNMNIKTIWDYAFEFGKSASLWLYGSLWDNTTIS